ncbi:hypothetical protein HUJ04_012879 [Dendroctonus ponderosae]|nr:hypothetical protein HUJ04_012879 [Dendroctonus ponderosae]
MENDSDGAELLDIYVEPPEVSGGVTDDNSDKRVTIFSALKGDAARVIKTETGHATSLPFGDPPGFRLMGPKSLYPAKPHTKKLGPEESAAKEDPGNTRHCKAFARPCSTCVRDVASPMTLISYKKQQSIIP